MTLELIIGVLLKATALYLCTWGLLFLLRRRSAAVRHLVLAGGLIGALLIPVLECIPGFQVLPAWSLNFESARASSVPDLVQRPAPPSNEEVSKETLPLPTTAGAGLEGESSGEGEGRRRDDDVTTGATSVRENTLGTPSGGSSSGVDGALAWLPSWRQALVAVWLIGMGSLLSRLLLGWITVRRIIARSEVCDDDRCNAALDYAQDVLGVRCRVTLLITGEPCGPMTWGVVNHVVILPDQARGWSPERLRAVLCHELAHVAR